jgi:hypothetical protein
MLHSVQVIKWAAMFVLVISIVVMSSFQRFSFSIFSHLQIKEKGGFPFFFFFFLTLYVNAYANVNANANVCV